MFSLIYAWTNGWINIRDAGDLRRHRTLYDVTVMLPFVPSLIYTLLLSHVISVLCDIGPSYNQIWYNNMEHTMLVIFYILCYITKTKLLNCDLDTYFTPCHRESTKREMQLSLIARFMEPPWGASGADRIQVGPMLTPWTLLSGMLFQSDFFQLSTKVLYDQYMEMGSNRDGLVDLAGNSQEP